MRKTALALSCFVLLGSSFAQQAASAGSQSTPSEKPSTAAASAVPAPPANPLTDAQAKQMLEMTGALEMKEQLTHSVMNYFRSAMPFIPTDVTADLEQSFAKLDLETPIIAIYKQHISAQDADSIIAFYKTPAGKNMIQAMPAIMQQSQQVGLQMGRKTAQEVVERHRAEIEAAAKQYREDHTPKPAPSLNDTPPSPSQSTPPASKPDSTAPSSSKPN